MQKVAANSFPLLMIAFASFVIGVFWAGFPVFIFIALAPILALRELTPSDELIDKLKYILAVPLLFISAHLVAGTIAGSTIDIVSLLIYGLASTLPFLLLEVSERYAPNKWGVMMLLVYWLGMEYLLLKIHPASSSYFLANALPIEWTGWNAYIGFLGGSVFVLLGNMLFYRALFRNGGILKGQVRWISLVLSILLVLVIAWWGIQFNLSTTITQQQMLNAYQTHSMIVENNSYHENGELFGRIGLWVTIMVILYTLVKSKMNKK